MKRFIFMKHTHTYFRLLLGALLLLAAALPVAAQTVKSVTVAQGKSYTDHISLRDDSRDMDLMVKFIFNEQTNTITVCLISYRDLFVFPADTPFRQTVSGRRIKPSRLPFVVDAAPDTRYELSRDYLRSLPKRRKKVVFHQWITASGMQAIPMEYRMVNDYISQDFTVTGKADAVTVTLRDVLMLQKDEASRKKQTRYQVVWGKDLNTTYHIYIERDPCFGKEEEKAAATAALEGLRTAADNIKQRYASGYAANRESLANFREMKGLLLGQYPEITEKSACPDVQAARDEYNAILASVKAMNCRLRSSSSGGGGAGGGASAGPTGEGVDAGFILTQARQIDETVSQWAVSTDKAQKADLKRKCRDIIAAVRAAIAQKGIRGEAQRRALQHFNEAIKYFQNTCH